MMKSCQIGLLLLCAGLMNACVATAIVGGAAVAGQMAYDERSIEAQGDDVVLASRISGRLIAEKDMPSRGLSVEVIAGEVILTGYLPSQEHIDRAVYICEHEDGVKKVINKLQIGSASLKSLFSDTAITASVKVKLLNDPFVKSLSIHVETVGGKVYLQGIIEDVEQGFRAKEIARKVKGVTAVENLLQVQMQQ